MSPSLQSGRGLSFFPPFIKFLLFANLGVFFLTSFAGGLTLGGEPLKYVMMEWLALWPFDGGFWPWQIISYQYLHGGVGHIFFNMLALWMFGMELENMWGSKRFALYYSLSGIAAALVHMVITPLLGGAGGPTIGASGSVMGVLLAFGLLFPNRPVMMFPIFFPIPARIFVLLYAGLDLVLGVSNPGDGVAHFAHLGGALGGFLLLKFGEPLFIWIENSTKGSARGFGPGPQIVDAEYRDVAKKEPAASRPAVQYEYRDSSSSAESESPTRFVIDGENVSQATIDEILDKISQAGYHSLSEREKNILYQVSKQL